MSLSPDIFTVSKVFYSLPFFLSSYFNILSWDSSKTSIGILLIPFILGIYFFFKQKYYIKYKFQLVFLTVWFILQNSIYIASRLGSRYLGFAYLPFLIIASFLIYIGIDNISRLINHKIQLRTKISKNTIFLILTLIFFSSTIYSALSMDKIKIFNGKILSETIHTIKKLDKDSYLILAGDTIGQVVFIAGNNNHIQYEDIDVNKLRNLMEKNKTIYMITYKKYFDEQLNFHSFYSKKVYNQGSLLTNIFRLELIDSKETIELYQLKN